MKSFINSLNVNFIHLFFSTSKASCIVIRYKRIDRVIYEISYQGMQSCN